MHASQVSAHSMHTLPALLRAEHAHAVRSAARSGPYGGEGMASARGSQAGGFYCLRGAGKSVVNVSGTQTILVFVLCVELRAHAHTDGAPVHACTASIQGRWRFVCPCMGAYWKLACMRARMASRVPACVRLPLRCRQSHSWASCAAHRLPRYERDSEHAYTRTHMQCPSGGHRCRRRQVVLCASKLGPKRRSQSLQPR